MGRIFGGILIGVITGVIVNVLTGSFEASSIVGFAVATGVSIISGFSDV